MALIWLRVYPVYDVLGFIFDLDKSNICRNLKPILAVLLLLYGFGLVLLIGMLTAAWGQIQQPPPGGGGGQGITPSGMPGSWALSRAVSSTAMPGRRCSSLYPIQTATETARRRVQGVRFQVFPCTKR